MTRRLAIRYIRRSDAYPGAADPGAAGSGAADPRAVSTGSLPAYSVVQTVEDDADSGRPLLTAALEPIAAGDVSVLVVPSLRTVAGSLRELVGLIDWLDAADAALVVEDILLDTASSAGQAMVAVLREIAGWDGEPEPGRPRRGRPGMSRLSPELAERIAAMRAAGMSLQAVADALNAEGTPTPRGGATWRPSSVQSALGYRRPRPPLPGMPPVPPKPPTPGSAHRPPDAPAPHHPPEHDPPHSRPRHGPPPRPRKGPRS